MRSRPHRTSRSARASSTPTRPSNKALGNTPEPPKATELKNGVALSGQSAPAGGTLAYSIVVPAGARSLALRTFGGSGDVTIYVKNGGVASASAYDYRSAKPATNSETVTLARPDAGTWYVTVDAGGKPFTNVTVQASFTAP